MRDGKNTLVATSGDSHVSIDVVNHPISGPVLAKQITPWVCTTAALGLGAPTDKDCNVPTQTTFSYRATDGSEQAAPGSVGATGGSPDHHAER